ncbi:MAG TPA: hypothetical protein VIJ14_01015, partial [Rhabdochlamydiaceae bacterium]
MDNLESQVERAMRILQGGEQIPIQERRDNLEDQVQRAMGILEAGNNQELTATQKALQVPYGTAETYGGLADMFGKYFSKVGEAETIAAPKGPKIYQEAVKEYQENPQHEAFLKKGLNDLAGTDLRPAEDDTAAQMRVGAGRALFPADPLTMASAAAMGSGSGALQSFGVNPLVSDLLAFGTPWGKARSLYGKFSNTLNGTAKPALTTAEKQVGKYLGEIPEEGPKGVIERIRAYESPIPGYKGTLAEIAETPGFAQLERTQTGKMTSKNAENRIVEHKERGTERLEKAVQDIMPKQITAEPGRYIQKSLKSELTAAEKARHAASNPHYTNVEKDLNHVPFKNATDYLDNVIAKGDFKKDVDYVKGMLNEGKKVSRDLEYEATYKNSPPSVRAKMKPPEIVETQSVAELDATRQAINAKIDEYSNHLTKRGNKRVGLLIRARNALDKDLAGLPEQIAATRKYKELSPRVNAIWENEILKPVVKQKHGEFTMSNARARRHFLSTSEEAPVNVRELRKVLGPEGPHTDVLRYEKIRQLQKQVVEKGKLTPAKMEDFMFKNKEAMQDLLTPDQQGVIKGL